MMWVIDLFNFLNSLSAEERVLGVGWVRVRVRVRVRVGVRVKVRG